MLTKKVITRLNPVFLTLALGFLLQVAAFSAIPGAGEADEMPRFPGCEEMENPKERFQCALVKMNAFIMDHLRYPAEAKEAGVSGKVIIGFTVDETGRLTDVEIVNDIGYGCGAAAMAVVEQMPQWIPGKKDGKPVKVEMKLPVKFSLNKSGEDQVYEMTDEMPRFPGCEDLEASIAEKTRCANGKLLEFIFQNIKYPEQAKKEGVEGLVVVSFVVDTDGQLITPTLARSLEASTDREVLRIVQLMNEQGKRWTPGLQDGKPVKVKFNLPVKFKLDGGENLPTVQVLEIEDFAVSPNPTDGLINLTFKAATGPTTIQVVDLSGREVYRQTVDDFNGFFDSPVNLEAAGAGLYFLNVIQGKRVFTEKIMVR